MHLKVGCGLADLAWAYFQHCGLDQVYSISPILSALAVTQDMFLFRVRGRSTRGQAQPHKYISGFCLYRYWHLSHWPKQVTRLHLKLLRLRTIPCPQSEGERGNKPNHHSCVARAPQTCFVILNTVSHYSALPWSPFFSSLVLWPLVDPRTLASTSCLWTCLRSVLRSLFWPFQGISILCLFFSCVNKSPSATAQQLCMLGFYVVGVADLDSLWSWFVETFLFVSDALCCLSPPLLSRIWSISKPV